MGPRRAVQTQTFFETAEKKVISMLQLDQNIIDL